MTAPLAVLTAARPLLERLDDAVLVLALDGRILFANDAARQLYGWQGVDVEGSDAALLVGPMDVHQAREIMTALARGHSWTGEFPVRHKNGDTIVVQCTNTPMVDETGRVVAAIGIARDVTEAVRAVESLRDRERQLSDAELLAGLGSWTAEPQSGRLTWSQGLYRILGLDAGVPPGIDEFMARIHPDDRPEVQRRIREVAAAGGDQFDVQYRVVRPDGEVRWTATRGRVVEADEHGAAIRVAGVTLDVTDDRHALALRSMAAATDDAVITASLDGVIASWNPGAERLYGFRADDVVGRSLFETIVPPDGADDTAAALADVARGARVSLPLTWGRRHDQQDVPVALVAAPVVDAAGRVTAAAVVSRDVSDRLVLLQQMSRATKLDAVGQLSAAIAHDFGNVLTAVDGFVRVIRDKAAKGEDFAAELDGFDAAVASGTRLIDRLLDFTAPGSPRPGGPFDVADVVADALPVLDRLAGEAVAVRAQECHSVRAKGDSNLLEQALVNLVVNARDAMPDGGTVTIECRRVVVRDRLMTAVVPLEPGAYAAITVTDSGVGMDAATLHRCVDLFFTTKPPGEGSGMGLPSVVSAMRANGGSVDLHSEPGRGTAVTLYWPAYPAAGP